VSGRCRRSRGRKWVRISGGRAVGRVEGYVRMRTEEQRGKSLARWNRGTEGEKSEKCWV